MEDQVPGRPTADKPIVDLPPGPGDSLDPRRSRAGLPPGGLAGEATLTRLEAPPVSWGAASPGESAATLRPLGDALPPAPSLRPGDEFDLGAIIAVGGCGEVWRARQSPLERDVALKRVRGDTWAALADKPAERASLDAALRAEALTAAGLEHPNIVPVHALGRDAHGRTVMAMQLVRGKSWRDLLRDERAGLDADEFVGRHVEILESVCQAIAFAHSCGVVHRDLKPSQVVVGRFGEVQVMDWGLALRLGSPGDHLEGAPQATPAAQDAPSPAGTPAYMAPEQTLDHALGVGPWTDVYLLGGCLHELLSGRPPHDAKTSVQALRQASEGHVPDLGVLAPHAPVELARLALAALAPRPEDRPPSAEAFLESLRAYRTGATKRHDAEVLVEEARVALHSPGADHAVYSEAQVNLARALGLWPGCPGAQELLVEARERQARLALRQGDLALAGSLAARLPAGETRDGLEEAIGSATEQGRRERGQRRVLQVAAAVLLAALAGSGALYVRNIEAARAEALRQHGRSEFHADKSRQLVSFTLSSLTPELKRMGRLDILRPAIDQTVAYYGSLPEEEMTPQRRATQALALLHLGELLKVQGEMPRAEEAFRAAIAESAELARGEDRDAETVYNHAWGHAVLAGLLKSQARCAEARAVAERGLEIAAQMQREFPGHPGGAKAACAMHETLGDVAMQLSDHDAALSHYVDFEEGLERADPELWGPEHQRDLAIAKARVSVALGTLYRGAEGLAKVDEARGLLVADPEDARAMRVEGDLLSQRGLLLALMERVEESRADEEAATRIFRELHERDPSNLDAVRGLHTALMREAIMAEQRRDVAAAEELLPRLLELGAVLEEREPHDAYARYNNALVHYRGALFMVATGREEEGARLARKGVELLEPLLEISEENPDALRLKGELLAEVARGVAAEGEVGRALEMLREGVELTRRAARIAPGDIRLRVIAVQAQLTLAQALAHYVASSREATHEEIASVTTLALGELASLEIPPNSEVPRESLLLPLSFVRLESMLALGRDEEALESLGVLAEGGAFPSPGHLGMIPGVVELGERRPAELEALKARVWGEGMAP